MSRIDRVLKALGVNAVPAGDELVASCPYHEDRNPSWSMKRIGDKAGLHRCFSCQSGGTLLDLVVHLRKTSYAGARRWLDALDDGTEGELPGGFFRVDVSPRASRAFRLPAGVCVEPLGIWPTPPRRFAEQRGLTEAQATRWGVGYAVTGPLAGRLVLVSRDRSGAARSFMARDYTGDGKRYLYPRAEDRPDLDVVFGEQHWPASGRARVFVAEGALNALAAERAGAAAVAALGGSQVRPAHLARLSTFREVVALTDPDEAGDRAAESLSAQLGRSVGFRRVRLPEGRDANDLTERELRAVLGV